MISCLSRNRELTRCPRHLGSARIHIMRYLIYPIVAVLLFPRVGHAEAPPFYADKSKLLVYIDAENKERPIRTANEWAKRRAHILANMQVVMGPMPDASRKVPLDVKVDDETKTAKFIRRQLT